MRWQGWRRNRQTRRLSQSTSLRLLRLSCMRVVLLAQGGGVLGHCIGMCGKADQIGCELLNIRCYGENAMMKFDRLFGIRAAAPSPRNQFRV